MKYGRWKREARALDREYRRKVQRMVVPVTMFGADPSGRIDSTEAIQKAVDYVGRGGMVQFPGDGVGENGEYRITKRLRVSED